jgi:hypothetical protein
VVSLLIFLSVLGAESAWAAQRQALAHFGPEMAAEPVPFTPVPFANVNWNCGGAICGAIDHFKNEANGTAEANRIRAQQDRARQAQKDADDKLNAIHGEIEQIHAQEQREKADLAAFQQGFVRDLNAFFAASANQDERQIEMIQALESAEAEAKSISLKTTRFYQQIQLRVANAPVKLADPVENPSRARSLLEICAMSLRELIPGLEGQERELAGGVLTASTALLAAESDATALANAQYDLLRQLDNGPNRGNLSSQADGIQAGLAQSKQLVIDLRSNQAEIRKHADAIAARVQSEIN